MTFKQINILNLSEMQFYNYLSFILFHLYYHHVRRLRKERPWRVVTTWTWQRATTPWRSTLISSFLPTGHCLTRLVQAVQFCKCPFCEEYDSPQISLRSSPAYPLHSDILLHIYSHSLRVVFSKVLKKVFGVFTKYSPYIVQPRYKKNVFYFLCLNSNNLYH